MTPTDVKALGSSKARHGNRISVGYYQGLVLQSAARFITLVAGRRFGKTTLLAIRLFMRAVNRRESLNWYIAPTYKMAKEIMWEPLKGLIPRPYVRKKHEGELRIELKNRSVIQLKGSDNPDSLRGPGLWTADFDEWADQEERTFSEVIRPALSDYQGSSLFAGTPKGYNHFFDYHQRALNPARYPDWAQFSYTTAHGGYVTLQEMREAKADLDPRVFRQEYKASFETLAGRVYDNFERHKHLDETLLDLGRELYIGLDFNINPMSAVVVQEVLGKPQVLASHAIMTSNTEEMAKFLQAKYSKNRMGKPRRLYVCPDASGNARHTSSPQGTTDFTILKRYGMILVVDKSNPQIVDRINNVQCNLLTGDGRVNILFHKYHCPELVKTMEGLTWKEGTNLPDKSTGLDHMGDALGYVLWQRFNILERALPRVAPELGPRVSPFEV